MSVGSDLRQIATHYTAEQLGKRMTEEMAELTIIMCKVERLGVSTNRKTELVNSLSNVLISARLLESVLGHEEMADVVKYKVEKELTRLKQCV